MKITPQTSISELPRIGKTLTKRLHKLGLYTVYDLLFYYPYRYHDFSTVVPIANIKIGENNTIKGKINIIANKRAYRRRMYITECVISDNTDSIKAIWFNQPFITKLLQQGNEVFLSGKVAQTKYGLQFTGPVYEKVKKEQTHTARIVPVYSSTENLTAKQIRFIIKSILPLAKHMTDWLPDEIQKKYSLLNLPLALREIHFPTNKPILQQARTRLKFNELFLIQLKTQAIRHQISLQKSPAIFFSQQATKAFVDALPFRLTNSQRHVAWQILDDIQKTKPMNRLLQGDVGSGKTVVSAIPMLNTALAGFQTALMAPTEILAQQHYQTLTKLFQKGKYTIALLTRTAKKINNQTITQNKLLEQIATGRVPIIIGTHAIIQEKVSFKNLGLVVIDEQHRFGVDQRKLLKFKNHQPRATSHVPHLLSMTATPIPRSLALTLYGDLDISLLTEMPANRKKVITSIVSPEKRTKAYDFIRGEIKKGRQVFVICPLIEESDKLGVRAATDEYEKLQKDIFPDLSIGLLHGKLKAKEKEEAMRQFVNKQTDILVATSVVEVGVDVPNATVMMIEGAERFGLAQLHQFRGRVGRSEHQSYCFIFTGTNSEKTLERLQALITSKNGFELAEKDLEFRGPGEIYGLRQSGFPDLKIAKLTDYQLINQTKQAAEKIFTQDPQLLQFPSLQNRFKQFEKNIHLE